MQSALCVHCTTVAAVHVRHKHGLKSGLWACVVGISRGALLSALVPSVGPVGLAVS